MFGITMGTYIAFLIATFVIVIVPGPDHVYLGAVALRDGRRAGIIATTGMALSMTIHTLIAVTGLGAALAAIPAALDLVRVGGALFLICLGIATLRKRSDSAQQKPPPSGGVLTRAMVVNLTNPKIALFFLAFLPQFVAPDSGTVPLQLLILGLSFVVLGFIVDAIYAIGGAMAGRFLTARGTRARPLTAVSGIVYLGLAAIILASLAFDSASLPGG
ncbi:LysE family translocator [Nesterenkonia muleiensis]|uniref:LysE family translocator n=1 Tax=Nesterenkonia muleiensis TaxID=2282648 RepID=UPI000E72CF07|nr:LysE family translocator [Nesterenkonia muleiensis]